MADHDQTFHTLQLTNIKYMRQISISSPLLWLIGYVYKNMNLLKHCWYICINIFHLSNICNVCNFLHIYNIYIVYIYIYIHIKPDVCQIFFFI